MRQVTRAAVLALALLMCLVSCAAAYSSPGIRIDGDLRNFDPPPQIINGRTMVPLRFVIEDEALKGEVFWDSKQHKAALNCRGKYIELFIGSNRAMVDGQTVVLDSSPYINQGRTFIPLRFLVETLGAKVEWSESPREVQVNFNQEKVQKPESTVFAYYYYHAFEEMKQNAHLFSDIAFRWFATNGKGELYYEYQDDYARILQFAREKGIKTHASVVLMGKEPLHQLLSNPANRSRLIGNLLQEVKSNHYDGVNIDFELMDPKDAGLFTTFLQELKTSLGPEISLSAAVFARTGQEKWATPYDYKQIGQIADHVIVMAYDYSYKSSPPGPVAPLWWVEQGAAYLSKLIPAEKILLGVPTYGYDWSSNGTAVTITAKKLADLKRIYPVKEHFDYGNMSPYYTYVDKENHTHQIWLENERSLAAKLKAARDYHLGGISFWRIGNGFDDLYQLLDR